MPLYAVIGLDPPPHAMKKRDAVRTEHRRYLKNNGAPIVFVGPFLDDENNQCGSFYIFEAKNEQEVRDWFKAEPFFETGVYKDFVIRRFSADHNLLPQKDAWGPGTLLSRY
ncbi:MAG TPA: YciI family protein [Rhizomicrobium sp.]|nr:YciI family protein [Rhizomicrobium sp.]